MYVNMTALSFPFSPLSSSYRFLLFWRHLSVSRSSFITGNSTNIYIYIYIYIYRKPCRQSSARATTGVVDTIVSRLIIFSFSNNFSIPLLFYFLFFQFFFFSFWFEYGNYRYSLIERLLPYSKYSGELGETYVTGSSDVLLFDCVLFACSYANNFVYGNCNMFNSWKDSLVEGRREERRIRRRRKLLFCIRFAWRFERKE